MDMDDIGFSDLFISLVDLFIIYFFVFFNTISLFLLSVIIRLITIIIIYHSFINNNKLFRFSPFSFLFFSFFFHRSHFTGLSQRAAFSAKRGEQVVKAQGWLAAGLKGAWNPAL